MPRKIIQLSLTEREVAIILEGLEMVYEDACVDADEGRAEEVSAVQTVVSRELL